jgi:thiol-disulfide isomerase/thioredoxin
MNTRAVPGWGYSTMSILPLAVAAAMSLAACGGPAATVTQSAVPAATSGSVGASASSGSAGSAGTSVAPAGGAASLRPGQYLEFQAFSADPAAHRSTDVVLFFHAPWCPDCRTTEASLIKDGVPAGLTVVKVDYDSMTELKQKYGITHQHTFVKIDAQGTMLAKWTGSFTGAAIKAKADAA